MTKHNESQETNGSEPHDSGKGESEHESLSSHNQNTYSIQQTIQESRFGPNCVSECSMNGHSDQCWLIELPRHFPRSQKTDYKVELKPVDASSSRHDIVESARTATYEDCNELYFQTSPPLDPRYDEYDYQNQSSTAYHHRGQFEHFP